MRRWLVILVFLATVPSAGASDVVTVGSKNFTEQDILGELVAQLIERTTDLRVERRLGLGGTNICHAALRSGEIDIYVEYTGTGLLNVLEMDMEANPAKAYLLVANAYRERWGLEWLPPIGFENGYAMSVRAEQAVEFGWTKVSDLVADQRRLTGGFPSEFMERPDGYPGLQAAYELELAEVRELDPGLMYRAVAEGTVDLICAFTTDGRIDAYELFTLEDDLGFFPPYDAAPVTREGLLADHPELGPALALLAGAIDAPTMRRMNYEVDELGAVPADVARRWIDATIGAGDGVARQSTTAEGRSSLLSLARDRSGELVSKSFRHLFLTGVAIAIAIGLGVPAAVLVHRAPALRGPALAAVEVLQTIPSLAMLAFLFAIYGLLGAVPAVTALVLYALLPIVANTLTGLSQVPRSVIEAADAVGMTGPQRLLLTELPLAAPVMIAGIRTSTVLTVGIATLATYIGAGGLGDFIARGLARNDARLTLLGAVPAAIMAVVLSLLIRAAERAVTRHRSGAPRRSGKLRAT